MSGYADDRFDEGDDRRDDEPERDRDPRRAIARARSQVMTPAILLIVTGALGLILAVLGLIQSGQIAAQFDEQIDQVEKNPGIPADQKKAQKEMLTNIRDVMVPAAMPLYAVNALIAAIVLFGGLKLRSLSGRGLVIAGSVLSMIPIVNGCCCLLGLPAGIWALIVLARPEVKAGFAAVEVAGNSPDRY